MMVYVDFDYRFDYHITDIIGSKQHFQPKMDKQNPLQIVDLQGVSLVRPVRFERMAFRVGV